MVDQERFTVNYTKNDGTEVPIKAVYFNNVGYEPGVRRADGGFQDDDITNACGGAVPRKKLIPRSVFVRFGQGTDSSGNPTGGSRLRVWVKDQDTYLALINGDQTPQVGEVVRYEGEQAPICVV